MRGAAAIWVVISTVLALVGAAGEVVGQQAGGEMSRADTVEFRQRQRLRTLGRPPGALPDSIRSDSIRADSIQADSVRRVQQSPTNPSFQEGDSTLLALRRALTGYDATSYVAIRAHYETERQELFLYGDSLSRASLRQPSGDEVTVDSLIRFNQRSAVAEALGAPTYAPSQGDPIESQRLVFDTRAQVGSAYEARTEYTQPGGATWKVAGDLPLVAGDVAYGDHSRFTSCDLEIPHYHFETPQLKIVQGRMLVARPVKLYFADVPVAWLPFVFQSLTQGRASGLLPPRFSVNDIVRTSGGYKRRVSNIGFYWAINDYMDGTLALDWFSDNYTGVTANLRYQWIRQFLNGSVTVRRFWRAQGRRELSFDTNQSWQMSERTSFTLSAQYATSTSFIRQNSFDPREVTSQIRSQGGLSRRFDWGQLNVSGDRSQSLSDDRVTMSLPRANLSLRPITLFGAPEAQASWYNNLTWSGGASFSRRSTNNPVQQGGFSFAGADQIDMDGSASSSFTLGRFSLGQTLRVDQGLVRDVPPEIFPDPVRIVDPFVQPGDSLALPVAAQILAGPALGGTDITSTDVNWSSSIGYQQPLIGTTTLTPNISISGSARRSDTLDVASGFVAAPTRVSFGASLKADFYGFYPGIGGFEAIRHKVSPTFDYSWAPQVDPTALQERVFGSRTLQRQSAVSIGFNQTWEGKRIPEESTDSAFGGTLPAAGDSLGAGTTVVAPVAPGGAQQDTGPSRIEQGEIVNILALRTSAIRYNFVTADDTGEFIQGFETTTLSNTIASDYLRGLTINMNHDLFDDSPGGEGGGPSRSFAPHLTRLNFSFNLDPRSGLLRVLGLGASSAAPAAPATDDPFDTGISEPPIGVTDEATIIPGRADQNTVTASRRTGTASPGEWSARFSYALNRPRAGGSSVSQILNMSVTLDPTAAWNMSWATAYDMESGRFNDHRISLVRDLHRWQANFDFLRTATGNWSFRFEVSLSDNRDLHFDYRQRSAIDEFIGG